MSNAKKIIDAELEQLVLSERAKDGIRSKALPKKRRSVLKVCVLACALFALLCGATAASAALSHYTINGREAGEFDELYAVQANELEGFEDDGYGRLVKRYSSYAALQEEIGIDLLDGNWTDADYIKPKVKAYTDEDYDQIDVFMLSNVLTVEGCGAFKVDLHVQIALTDERASKIGYGYLGEMYNWGTYTSAQGYKVNFVRCGGTTYADFVADGMFYHLVVYDAYGALARDGVAATKKIVDSLH